MMGIWENPCSTKPAGWQNISVITCLIAWLGAYAWRHHLTSHNRSMTYVYDSAACSSVYEYAFPWARSRHCWSNPRMCIYRATGQGTHDIWGMTLPAVCSYKLLNRSNLKELLVLVSYSLFLFNIHKCSIKTRIQLVQKKIESNFQIWLYYCVRGLLINLGQPLHHGSVSLGLHRTCRCNNPNCMWCSGGN